MAQFLRPDSDVTVASWVTAPLWSKIDEATADDADSINDASSNTTCEVGLSDGIDPASSTGHIMRMRGQHVGGSGDLHCQMYLVQGGTTIASFDADVAATLANFSLTLSAAQADAITDYTDLRFRFDPTGAGAGSRQLKITWAELEIPDAPTGAQTISPGLLDHSTSLFAPAVALAAAVGLIDHAATLFAPALGHRISVPLIEHSVTVFGPEAGQPSQSIAVPLIDHTTVVFGPTVAGEAEEVSDKHYVRFRRRGMRSQHKGGM